MAVIQCPNGHLYDTNIYGSCPYCRGSSNMIDFENKTAAPENYGGTVSPENYGGTVAPGGFNGDWQASNGSQFQTVPINTGNQDNRTVAPDSFIEKEDAENPTIAVFKEQNNLDPVVGWLVCVDGANKGKSYELFARINSIGRGKENDVNISGEPTISRNHVKLAYDPRHNGYQLIPAESKNNIYLNDDPVYVPTKLQAYDLIELGEGKFLFIPLCGERFSWKQDR